MTPAQRLARDLADMKRRLGSVERASQGNRRSVEGGAITVFDTDGTVRATVGLQSDGTTAIVTQNDPVPPAPSAAIVFPAPGGLEITWDGTFAAGATRTADTKCVNVHAAPGAGAFTPDATTIRASLIGRGTVTVDLPAGDPYTVVLVAETTGGSLSAGSVPAVETPAPSGGDGTDQTARDLAAAAQARADKAVADAAAAEQAAQDAQTSATAVSGDVATAQQAAEDADAAAQSALSQAQTAQQTGTSAQQAADLAKSAADAAQQAANSSGTAASQASADAAAAAAKAAQALADAATASGTASSALTSANGKVRYFTSATAPSYSGAADTALWIDTANGRRINRWNGSGWDAQQFGNLALQPGSIVASDVLVQGTITGALLKADAIDGKTVTGATVRTAASGQRVEVNSSGVVGYNSAGTAVTTISSANGSLTATAGTITGATLRTAASGQRVQIDSTNGLVGYDSTGAAVTSVGTNGKLSATGATITGVIQTADTGPRVSVHQLTDGTGGYTSSGGIEFLGEDATLSPKLTGSSGLTWGSSTVLQASASGGKLLLSYTASNGGSSSGSIEATTFYMPENTRRRKADGTDLGPIAGPQDYFCQKYASAAQDILNNAWTPILMQVNEYAYGGSWTDPTALSQFVAPIAGVYEFQATVTFTAGANVGNRAIRYAYSTVKGGAPVTTRGITAWDAPLGTSIPSGARKFITLQAGGWIEAQALQTSGGTLATAMGPDYAPQATCRLVRAL